MDEFYRARAALCYAFEVVFQKVTRGLPEGATQRVTAIARVGARYGFGFVFRQRVRRGRRPDPGQVGVRLRRSFEELGPNFVELGRFLAARRDRLPPDVAAELEGAAALPKPLAFAEARAVVERELGNTLERLFPAFEDRPARVGPFTQAHRAVLPGDRPALVVVDRPGVRGDLLAMRPVADLVRRRIGDRLPLDPSEMVSEFVAHVGHRRDMHFAAQTVRRLRELDRPGLYVPDVYRDYSTARCITFEAPALPEPLDEHRYREASAALVRLAIEEGVFFADPAPERFAVSGGEVWLADPTEVFALDPERMHSLAEVLAAVRRGDVDGLARGLRLAGAGVPKEASALRRELREALGALGGPLWPCLLYTSPSPRDRG
jgi:ubiquinone biosynthesis protein